MKIKIALNIKTRYKIAFVFDTSKNVTEVQKKIVGENDKMIPFPLRKATDFFRC
jgi:hypothetical protein